MDNYGIGNTEVKGDDSEAFADIPRNRTLIAEQLTKDAPMKPDIVYGLQTLQQVFAHYSPEVSVGFEDENGVTRQETLHFNSLADFGIKSLTEQSHFLKDSTARQDEYFRMINQLQSNKALKAAIVDPAAKQALLDTIHEMIAGLKNNEANLH